MSIQTKNRRGAMLSWSKLILLTSAVLTITTPIAAQDRKPHNVILFVPDGLRAPSA